MRMVSWLITMTADMGQLDAEPQCWKLYDPISACRYYWYLASKPSNVPYLSMSALRRAVRHSCTTSCGSKAAETYVGCALYVNHVQSTKDERF